MATLLKHNGHSYGYVLGQKWEALTKCTNRGRFNFDSDAFYVGAYPGANCCVELSRIRG